MIMMMMVMMMLMVMMIIIKIMMVIMIIIIIMMPLLYLISVNSEANSRRINNVEKCFGASGQPLAVSGRVLVGEGVLTKLCRKKPKPRQVSLKDMEDIFHIYLHLC